MSEIKEKKRFSHYVEVIVEKFLWNFRFIILLGVIGLLVGSAVVFVMGIIETFHMTKMFVSQLLHHSGHIEEVIYKQIIVQTITIVDDFLLATVLLIFGLGTYDLFISRLDPAEQQEDIRPDWLVFNSLDELKSVLGKVVLMIMIINFLKFMVNMEYGQPLHLLYLGGAIALVGLALKLSHGKDIETTTMKERLEKIKINKTEVDETPDT